MTAGQDEVLAELAALRARVAQLEGSGEEQAGERVSRRRLFGAAAAGLGALGLAVTEAAPATAATGDPLLLGRDGTVNTTGDLTVLGGGGGLRVEVRPDSELPPVIQTRSNALLTAAGAGTREAGLLASGVLTGVEGFAMTEDPGGVGVRGRGRGGAGVLGTASLADGGVGVAGRGAVDLSADGSGLIRQAVMSQSGPPPTGPRGALLARDADARLYVGEAEGWTRAATVHAGYAGGAWHALLDPVRALDTRSGRPAVASGTGPVRQGAPLAVEVAVVSGDTVVPPEAVLVVGNLTLTGATGAGHVTVVAHGRPKGSTSTLGYRAGQTVSNALTVAVVDGQVDVHVTGAAVHVVLDLVAFVR